MPQAPLAHSEPARIVHEDDPLLYNLLVVNRYSQRRASGGAAAETPGTAAAAAAVLSTTAVRMTWFLYRICWKTNECPTGGMVFDSSVGWRSSRSQALAEQRDASTTTGVYIRHPVTHNAAKCDLANSNTDDLSNIPQVSKEGGS